MAKDLYDCIILKQTIPYCDVCEYSNNLLEDDPKVLDLLRSLFTTYVETMLFSNGVVVEGSPTYSDLDSEDNVREILEKYINNEKLKKFISEKSVLNPFILTNMNDPRNKKIVADNWAEAKKLSEGILKLNR